MSKFGARGYQSGAMSAEPSIAAALQQVKSWTTEAASPNRAVSRMTFKDGGTVSTVANIGADSACHYFIGHNFEADEDVGPERRRDGNVDRVAASCH